MGWCDSRPSGNKRLMTPTRKADDPRRRKLVLALSLISCAILGSVVMVGWDSVTEGMFSGQHPAASPPSHPSGAVFFKPKRTTTAMVLSHIHELATSELDGAGTPEARTPVRLPRADGPLHETCTILKNSTAWPEAKAIPAGLQLPWRPDDDDLRLHASAGARICRVRAP